MTQNPYEPPRYETPELHAPELTYYQTVASKLTVREYYNLSKNWLDLLLGLLFKVFRLRLPQTFALSDAREFRVIEAADVTEQARQKLEPIVSDALALNMQYALTYSLATIGTIEVVAVAMQSDDGCVFMSIVYVRVWNELTVDEKVTFSFISLPVDGSVLVTSGNRPDLQPPSNYHTEHHPGMPLDKLLARHRARLDQVKSALTPIRTLTELEQTIRHHEQELFAFQIERGVYQPISARKIEQLQRLASSVAPPSIHPEQPTGVRWVEFICWIVLGVSLFTFTQRPGVNQQQAMFRMIVLVAAVGGIAITWLLRLVKPDQNAT